MNFWAVVSTHLELSIFVLLIIFSLFSKKISQLAYAYIVYLIVLTIAGKTTSFNVNIIATIGITASVGGNIYQFLENKKLKNKKGGK